MPVPQVQRLEGICLGTAANGEYPSGGSVTRSGTVGTVAIADTATLQTNAYQPTNGQSTLKFAINMNVAGTARLYRIGADGTGYAQGASTPVVAGDELRISVTNPLKSGYYVEVTNSSGGAGTVIAEVYGVGAQQ